MLDHSSLDFKLFGPAWDGYDSTVWKKWYERHPLKAARKEDYRKYLSLPFISFVELLVLSAGYKPEPYTYYDTDLFGDLFERVVRALDSEILKGKQFSEHEYDWMFPPTEGFRFVLQYHPLPPDLVEALRGAGRSHILKERKRAPDSAPKRDARLKNQVLSYIRQHPTASIPKISEYLINNKFEFLYMGPTNHKKMHKPKTVENKVRKILREHRKDPKNPVNRE